MALDLMPLFGHVGKIIYDFNDLKQLDSVRNMLKLWLSRKKTCKVQT